MNFRVCIKKLALYFLRRLWFRKPLFLYMLIVYSEKKIVNLKLVIKI